MIKILNNLYTWKELWKILPSVLRTGLSCRRILNLFRCKWSFWRRETRLRGSPLHLLVEPSRLCNFSCPFCLLPISDHLRLNHSENGIFPFAQFERLLEEMGDMLWTIRFWHYGEPLMNPDLFRMIHAARERKIFTVLSTNFSMMSETKMIEMLESGLDYLIVSLDATTSETYKKMRSCADGVYEQVVSGIGRFVELRKKLGRRTPFFELQFLVTSINEHELPAMKRLAVFLQADKFSPKRLLETVQDGGLRATDPVHRLVVSKQSQSCRLPYEESLICADGTVIPCAQDSYFQWSMGNYFKQKDFRDLWNHEKYQLLRKTVLNNIEDVGCCCQCAKRDNNLCFISMGKEDRDEQKCTATR